MWKDAGSRRSSTRFNSHPLISPRHQSLEERLWITEQELTEEAERRLRAEQLLVELTCSNEEQQAAIHARDQRISDLENLLKEALIQGAVLSKEVFALSKEKADAQVAYLTEKRLVRDRLPPVLEHAALVENDSSLTRYRFLQSALWKVLLCLLVPLICSVVLCALLESNTRAVTVVSVAAAILGVGLATVLFGWYRSLANIIWNPVAPVSKCGSLVEPESAKMRNEKKQADADLHSVTPNVHLQALRAMERHQIPKCSPRGPQRSPRFRPAKGGC